MGQLFSNNANNAANGNDPNNRAAGRADASMLSPAAFFSPLSLSLSQLSTAPVFPLLTQSQLASIRDSGIDFDLCFQSHQMPRLPSTTWSMNDSNADNRKEKKFVYLTSPVNVSKSSLKVATLDDQRQLSFFIDSSVKARLRIYIACHEHNYKNLTVTAPVIDCPLGTSVADLSIDNGNRQLFTIILNDLIPSSLLSNDSVNLLEPSRHCWPLIIHLEDLTAKPTAACEGGDGEIQPQSVDHVLLYCTLKQSSPPPQPSAASTATTLSFAALLAPTNDIAVTIHKRVVWCGSHRFATAEIYGLGDTDANSNANSSSGNECIICLTNRRTHAIYPCRHFCLCTACSALLQEQTNRCPICRRGVSSVIPIRNDDGGARDNVQAPLSAARWSDSGSHAVNINPSLLR